ncbi:MAG TPA: helix-turn-helix transcriptional regulator [Acidimicrobiales bacterium]|nr:helix-turn-helix transcriptional regulator [Acidimicrobiales bacterium]
MAGVNVAELLRAARNRAGLTTRELARRTGVRQSQISNLENGAHSPTVTTLDKLAKGLNTPFVLVASPYLTAADTAAQVKALLQRGNVHPDGPIWQLANDLASAEPCLRATLALNPAPLTGDPRRDAWIAGLVEYRLAEVGIAAPAWAGEPARVANAYWPVSGARATADIIRAETPEPFARRRVLITADDLVSY